MNKKILRNILISLGEFARPLKKSKVPHRVEAVTCRPTIPELIVIPEFHTIQAFFRIRRSEARRL